MDKIVLDKNKKKLIDSIFEHYTDSGKCYSIHFTDTDDVVWCDDICEVYVEIEKHVKSRSKL